MLYSAETSSPEILIKLTESQIKKTYPGGFDFNDQVYTATFFGMMKILINKWIQGSFYLNYDLRYFRIAM